MTRETKRIYYILYCLTKNSNDMKKTLFAIALAMTAMVSSAQVFVGGGLGFSSSKYEGSDYSSTSFNFSPEVGYVLDDVWSFGLPISIATERTALDKALEEEGESAWSIAPYARYTFFRSGSLSVFVDGILGLSGADDDSNVSLSVAPGVAYGFTENISVVTRLGSLGWNNQYGNGSYFGLNADASIGSVALYYTF